MDIVPFIPPNRYSMDKVVLSSSLKVIPDTVREIFYWIILVEVVVALVVNCLAIRSIIKKKWKFMKKTCLISLAITDIFTVTICAVNNLEVLSNPLMIWTLGEFMCYFVSMAKVFGTTASSLALLIIALDRYQTVNLGKSWNPNKFVCIIGAIMLLLICAVLAYPMFTFYDYKHATLLDDSFPRPPKPVFHCVHLCAAINKDPLAMYYLVMVVVIFLPIVVIFVWFYFSIASLIWKHRKPVGSSYILRSEEFSTTSSCNLSASQSSNLNQPKNVQVKKKIRSFRIVIVLMICFVICRLPYWLFYSVSLLTKIGGCIGWTIVFILLSFNLLNCILNPLLYTFLNETVSAFKIFNDFVCKVFCCCCSNDDFDEFEKNNPFEPCVTEHKVKCNQLNLKPNYKVTFIGEGCPTPRADNYLPKY